MPSRSGSHTCWERKPDIHGPSIHQLPKDTAAPHITASPLAGAYGGVRLRDPVPEGQRKCCGRCAVATRRPPAGDSRQLAALPLVV